MSATQTSAGAANGSASDSAARAAVARRRANTELGLLILALFAALAAATLVEFSQQPTIPDEVVTAGGVFLGGAVVAHLVKRWLAPGSDPILLPAVVLLNGLGLVMVRRIDFARAANNPDATALAGAQTMWSLVAVVAFCATLVLLRDHVSLDRYRYLIGIGSVLLMLTPLLPGIGREVNGARIWVHLAGMTFQPVEIAKIGLTVFFASYLAEKRDVLAVATNRLGPVMVPPARAFAPLLGIWALGLAVLGLQNDLGPTLLIYGVFLLTLYVATGRLAYPLVGIVLAGVGAYLAYQLFAHVRSRISIWLDVWSQYSDAGYQLAQSLFALGTGGLAGVGLGQGQPDFIPFVETDFILSAFGEEAGLLGTTAIVLCFLLIAGRGFRIAMRARDEFGALLAAGLTSILGLQAFVIIGGITRLIPLTGITLPFMSYGGSSLLANYALVALLVRVSAPMPPLRRRRRTPVAQEHFGDTGDLSDLGELEEFRDGRREPEPTAGEAGDRDRSPDRAEGSAADPDRSPHRAEGSAADPDRDPDRHRAAHEGGSAGQRPDDDPDATGAWELPAERRRDGGA